MTEREKAVGREMTPEERNDLEAERFWLVVALGNLIVAHPECVLEIHAPDGDYVEVKGQHLIELLHPASDEKEESS